MRTLARIILPSLLLFFANIEISAQLCEGSLGDPIVNITFGSGGNPGARIAAAATNYSYISGDCPADGSYTIRNSTNGCFGNTWHSVVDDHTSDANGYFMLVNASFQPSAFYVDTVRGLCSGTTFEFAAWIMNVLRPGACGGGIRPDLTFTIENIDGSVIQSYNTGSIGSDPVSAWKQFGFFFTTPAGISSIVLRIVNNAPGGCGNDLALDDITFRPCGPQLTAFIDGTTDKAIVVCEGNTGSYTLNSTISAGFINPFFQWQQSRDSINWTDMPGETSATLTRTISVSSLPGKNYYRVSAAESGNMNFAFCRVASEMLSIEVAANPVAEAASNGPVCEHAALVLSGSGGASYQWTGPNGFTATGESVSIGDVQIGQSGAYEMLATSSAGCSASDAVDVIVNPSPMATTSTAVSTICEGQRVQLLGSGGGDYLWIPGAGLSSSAEPNPMAFPSDTTHYNLVVRNEFECADTVPVVVNVIAKPNVNAGPDQSILQGDSVLLPATVIGQNLTYHWTPASYISNEQALQPVVSPPQTAVYSITVNSGDGCGMATDEIKVNVFKDVYVPNAFTPNRDGRNDTWEIPALAAYPGFELSVYSRHGQIIFQSIKSPVAWDGRFKGEPLPGGSYVYVLKLSTGRMLRGTITIVR